MFKYVIYGAGRKGKALFDKLKKLGLGIDYFCDSDPAKHADGKKYCNIPVIAPQALSKIKEEAYIFVSPKNADDIYEYLSNGGFPHVCPPELIIVFDKITCRSNKEEKKWPMFDPGHFYSLYPDINDFLERKDKIYNHPKILDIDLNIDTQLRVYNELSKFYDDLPDWPNIDSPENYIRLNKYRYRYLNLSFPPGDSVHLHCMLRYLQPKRLIEVGSGYTSAITLDTNEFYLDHKIDIEFIEPYPGILKTILKPNDKINLSQNCLQDIPLSYFEKLQSGDVLFIDSTHVSKFSSDVNYLFFEILPNLKPGVHVHLHDIFYPFEYPEEWIINGMIWNEVYLLRAFLLNNNRWEILFFQNFFEREYNSIMKEKWPLSLPFHGGSFWMRKK